MTDIKKLKYYINSQEKMINAIVSYLNGGMRNDLEVLKKIVEHLEEKPTEKIEVTEKVFIPKHQEKEYHLPGSLFNFDELM